MNTLKKVLSVFIILALTVILFACNNVKSDIPTGDNVGSFGTYEALKDYLKANYDNTKSGGYYVNDSMLESATDSALDGSTSDTPDRNFSQTNIQVEGVNEADRIITDGYNIYVLSGNNLFIVDADTLDIVYTYTTDESYLSGMYLFDDKLVVLAHSYYYTGYLQPDTKDDPDVTTSSGSDENGDKTIDDSVYESYVYTYGVKVIVFDVSDTSDVTVDRDLYFEYSNLADSRMIDGNLFLIMNNYQISYGYDKGDVVPRYKDSVISDDFQELSADKVFFMPDNGTSYSYLQLVTFDVTGDKPANVKAYLGSTYQIYMSMNNLYAVVYNWDYDEVENFYEYHTFVLRFEIEGNELAYKAIGEISGHPLNQFSMDEYDGVFRIATTNYDYNMDNWELTITNQLYLLDATSLDKMDQLSVLDNLGKEHERIYAVRFDEDIAYVVTFVNTDPLYKLDLSDPNNPKVAGELSEEGVSDYLHKISDELLLGIGRQADNSGDFTRFTGVKVSLYDITGDTPINIQTYLVEGEYSYTNVTYDHKAFVTYEPKDADYIYVAIPIYEYYDDYSGYSQNEYIFKVYYSGSFELVAKLSNIESDQNYYYFDSIERAVFIDNSVYTISFSKIKKFNIGDNFSEVKSTVLNQDYYMVYGYPEVDTVK